MRTLALWLLVTGWGVPLAFPHLAEDDLLCAIAEATGDQRDARVAGAGSTAPTDHCAVCHSQRSFRHAGLDDSAGSSVDLSVRLLPPADGPRLFAAASPRLPARAPPV